METAGFPNFRIQANSSLLASGDTLVVKCLISNIALLTLVNSFSVNWFKDDVRITKSYNDVIDDGRYSVQLEVASQEKILSRLQITGISDEDEGTFTCELTDSNSNKRRQSISILIDDRDDTTSTDNRHYDKSNKAAYGNTTDQAVIDYENVTYITVAMEDITDDITDITTAGVSITQESNTTYEQTTAYQIETARPDYARPRHSRFEPVSIEMNQPMAARGTAGQKKRNYEQATDDTFLNEYRTGGNGTYDGSENIRKSKNTDPLIKTRRKNYEQATDDTFLNEYRTGGNGDRDWPHGHQNRTADFEEAIATNYRHDPDQNTTFTDADIEGKDNLEPAQIVRDTNTFSIPNASFSVESLETDNVNGRDEKKRKHPYEKWNKDFLDEFL
uniref:Uncharacterized protein n=1 Tax=Magallana gigas TaxID=29159 RepID=K1PPJ4_MAGGI